MTDFYVASAVPSTGSALSSSVVRAEFALIAAAMAKLAPYTGHGGEIVAVNAGGTAYESIATTGTGNVVKDTNPALVTPDLGAATGTSIVLSGGITATGGTLTSPTLVTPAIGTPASGVLTNCTGTAAGLTAGTATTANSVTSSLTGFLRADAGVLSTASQLIAFTTITSTNAAWSPDAATKKIIVEVHGGGGAGCGVNGASYAGLGGYAGTVVKGVSTSVSGTYALTIGAGGTHVNYSAGNQGGTSSVIGTGLSVSAVGGLGGTFMTSAGATGTPGQTGVGIGGAAGANAAANSAAGGGGGQGGSGAGGDGGSGIIYIWEYA